MTADAKPQQTAEGVRDAEAAAAPMTLAFYAWRVAGPIDGAINALLNGAIAAWFYGGADRVPLTGPASAESMLVPMATLICGITTFTGWWNAIRERRAGRVAPPLTAHVPWVGRALRDAIVRAILGGLTMWGACRGLEWLLPAAALPGWGVVCGVAQIACGVGWLVHATAILCTRCQSRVSRRERMPD